MPVDTLDQVDPRDLGARLREARTASSSTQEQAADAIGAARTTMVAIEKGERRLKPEELVALARLYGRKVSWFLRQSAPVEGFSVQLRGALPPETPVDVDLLPSIRDLEKLCDDYMELERLCGAPAAHRLLSQYSTEGGDLEAVAEEVANAERNRLGLGDAPVLNLRAVLEGEVGLLVFYIDLPSKVAGMFAYTDAYGGVLGINRKHPPERRRHTMAHEFGHFLTDRYRSEITFLGRYERRPAAERFAENFGRAFLMPAASVRRRFHELVRQRGRHDESDRADQPTTGDVVHLAHFFFVSFEVMTRRLEELRLIPSGTWARLNQQGFRIGEARCLLGLREQPMDDALLPTRYRYLAVEAWQRGDLSEGQLASFLHVDRLTARRMVQDLGLDPGDETHGGDRSLDLFRPLAAGEAG